MAIALDPDKVTDYIPLLDRELPPDQQSTFKMKALSGRDFLEISQQPPTMVPPTVLEKVLVGWENFPAGEPIAFPTSKRDAVARLRLALMIEMATEATKAHKLTEEELGKLTAV